MEANINRLGISQARYKLFKKYLGLDPGCGCSYRIDVFDRLGLLFTEYRSDHGLVAAVLRLPALATEAKTWADKPKVMA